MTSKMKYTICKINCGSVSTKLYKNRKYRYEKYNDINIKVYNEVGAYVFFYEKDFKNCFYSEQELRKEKLKKNK